MTRRSGFLWFIGVALLAALLIVFHSRIHFDWPAFFRQVRNVSAGHIFVAIAIIYATFWMRALRWAIFLRSGNTAPAKTVHAAELLGPQFIGFTALSLFGRLADLTRPYIIARRVHRSFASQVAVYTIERMFDLGAAALIFSIALSLTPKGLPHHEVFIHAGEFALLGTVALAIFALIVRLAGETVARHARRILSRISTAAGEQVAEKLLSFRHGLGAISSLRDFTLAALLSIAMWGIIGEAYVQTVHAFVHTPQLVALTYSRTMLLMAASIGGSVLQLPVIGWFTQIAVTAAAMHAFYAAPIEDATACGALLFIVLSLSIIPAGLVFARIERVSLRAVAQESGEQQSGEKDSGAAATDLTGDPLLK